MSEKQNYLTLENAVRAYLDKVPLEFLNQPARPGLVWTPLTRYGQFEHGVVFRVRDKAVVDTPGDASFLGRIADALLTKGTEVHKQVWSAIHALESQRLQLVEARKKVDRLTDDYIEMSNMRAREAAKADALEHRMQVAEAYKCEWTEEEKEVLESLAKAKDMTIQQVLRQALRLYQLETTTDPLDREGVNKSTRIKGSHVVEVPEGFIGNSGYPPDTGDEELTVIYRNGRTTTGKASRYAWTEDGSGTITAWQSKFNPFMRNPGKMPDHKGGVEVILVNGAKVTGKAIQFGWTLNDGHPEFNILAWRHLTPARTEKAPAPAANPETPKEKPAKSKTKAKPKAKAIGTPNPNHEKSNA